MRPTFRSKPQVVHEMLREAIIHGDYKPGERLVIDEVAARLGVSQIPVREAVRQLEADGLVTIEPYTGATVTQFSPTLIFEIFALLEALEVICGRRACICMSDEELAELAAVVTEMDGLLGDPENWSRKKPAISSDDLSVFSRTVDRTDAGERARSLGSAASALRE